MAAPVIIGVSQTGGNKTFDGPIVKRKYTLTFIIRADTVDQHMKTIEAETVGLPKLGDVWEIGDDRDVASRCEDVSIDARGPREPLIWEAVCQFSSEASEREEEEGEDTDPEEMRPRWEWSSETMKRWLPISFQNYNDITGAALTDSLWPNKPPVYNEPRSITYSNGQEVFLEQSYTVNVLKITRYEEGFLPTKMDDLVNHVNLLKFWQAAGEVCLCTGIEDSPADIDGKDLREVVYTFKFDKEETWTDPLTNIPVTFGKWRKVIADSGSYFLPEAPTTSSPTPGDLTIQRKFYDDDDNEIRGWLNGYGNRAKDDSGYEDGKIFLSYKVYPSAIFPAELDWHNVMRIGHPVQ